MLDLGLGTEALIILTLILINGMFAMSEIAVISARKTRLRQRAAAGDAKAARALELAAHPNRFLSTAQIGITLVGILAGAYGGATVAGHLDAYLQRFDPLARFSEQLSLGLVVLTITYLSLVIGELVPKRIALTYPEKLAASVAGPMHTLSVLASPLVRLLSTSTDAVLRVLRVHKVEEPPVTDILAEIAGDLSRAAEPRIVQRRDGSWLMDGSLAMTDVWHTLRPAEAQAPDGRSVTLGAFMVDNFQHVPISGEYFDVEGYRFEVVDMDGSHVDKVLISRLEAG